MSNDKQDIKKILYNLIEIVDTLDGNSSHFIDELTREIVKGDIQGLIKLKSALDKANVIINLQSMQRDYLDDFYPEG